MTKTYWAVVKNPPPKQADHLVHYLKKNEKQNKSYARISPAEGYKKAELKYRVIANSDNYFLVEVELITGRHHQIRVQLSAIGCPIKGDLKYGFPRSNRDASIHLHSRTLTFVHPVRKEEMTFHAPAPDDVVWNAFVVQD